MEDQNTELLYSIYTCTCPTLFTGNTRQIKCAEKHSSHYPCPPCPSNINDWHLKVVIKVVEWKERGERGVGRRGGAEKGESKWVMEVVVVVVSVFQ